MCRMLNFASVLTAVLALAALSGCTASHEPSESKSYVRTAMTCPTCKNVWTFETVGQGTKAQRLSPKAGMSCPECDAMAAAYVKDGETVLHECATCKVVPTIVKETWTPSHPKGTHQGG